MGRGFVRRSISGTPKREDIECPSRLTRFDSECSSTPRPATGFEGFSGSLICGSASANDHFTPRVPLLSSLGSADRIAALPRQNDVAVGPMRLVLLLARLQ